MVNFGKIVRALAVSAAVTGLIAPVAAAAQDVPSYAVPPQEQVQQAPPQANDQGDETVTGQIASVDGPFNIQVADERGFVDNVQLHQGTVINPTGLTLAAGMDVTIQGYADDGALQANEIDTPYEYAGPLPTPVYYGAGYWYPGFAYGYGPAFGLSFVFGSGWARRPFDHVSAWNGRAWNSQTWAAHPYNGSFRGAGGYNRPTAFNRVSGFAGSNDRAGYRAPSGYTGGRDYAAPARSYGYSGTARSYSAPARSYGGYQSQARSYGGGYSAGRSYSAPARSYSAGRSYSAPARSGGGDNHGGRH
jgi:hypothetical protein